MAKRVYFCFHYQDVADFRVNVVRNHWLTKSDREDAGFFDASLWEEARKRGDAAIKRLINSGLDGTSVTCILIGSQTYARRWVRYEIMKSFKRGNSIFGIHINSIAGKDRRTKTPGVNPLEYLGITFSESGLTATLHEVEAGQWQEYTEIDGSASYLVDAVPQQYRGRGYHFGNWYPVYDWVAADGYNNFASWVG
jgi:hypothetical protein